MLIFLWTKPWTIYPILSGILGSYLLFGLLVGLWQDEIHVDAEVVLGQELVLVVTLEAGWRVVDESFALKDTRGICDVLSFTK